jgi:hypothetical protein
VLPGVAVGYATYPSTEYLMPRTADFFGINLYLEDPGSLAAYLARLQNLAGDRPLLVTEFGLDVLSHGESQQRQALGWSREVMVQGGVAGCVWFAFTDEWQRGGALVEGWKFGLVTAERQLRPAALLYGDLPVVLPLEESQCLPVSVIVCTRNGAATLEACLRSLHHLRYPRYEILLVDDGSRDAVPEIAAKFPAVRYFRQDPAGLSAARNRGMEEAWGELLAYTDDDCVAHPEWLAQVCQPFQRGRGRVVASGGPNIPPLPRNGVEAVVAWAGAPKPKTPAKTSETVTATAVDLVWITTLFIFTPQQSLVFLILASSSCEAG